MVGLAVLPTDVEDPLNRRSCFEFDGFDLLQAAERDFVAGHLAQYIAWHIAIIETVDFRVFIGRAASP